MTSCSRTQLRMSFENERYRLLNTLWLALQEYIDDGQAKMHLICSFLAVSKSLLTLFCYLLICKFLMVHLEHRVCFYTNFVHFLT